MADLLEDPNETVWISIPLDGETAARLRYLSDICHAEPTCVAASLLHDVLKDDAETHQLLTPPSGVVTFN